MTEEQPSGERARALNGAEKVAESLDMTRSNRASVVNAIPNAGPFTRASFSYL